MIEATKDPSNATDAAGTCARSNLRSSRACRHAMARAQAETAAECATASAPAERPGPLGKNFGRDMQGPKVLQKLGGTTWSIQLLREF